MIVGLKESEVAELRKQFGENILEAPPRDPLWKQFLSKFEDPVIRILLIAAVLSIIVGIVDGHFVEGIGIILAVLLATGLAFWNEYRADKAFDLLQTFSDDTPAIVFRDDHFRKIPRREIVVNDLVQVDPGEEIPADGELIKSNQLTVNESKLTGEAAPVEKGHSAEESHNQQLLFRGTIVTQGQGLFRVSSVGPKTEIGKTAIASVEESSNETPLARQLAKLSKIIGVVGLFVAAIVFTLLIVKDSWNGTLNLSANEWITTTVLFVAVAIALIRVWLPIVFDGIELMTGESPQWNWLEQEGIWPWLQGLIAAALIAAFGFGYCFLSKHLDWLDHQSVNIFLQAFLVAVTIIVVAVPEGLAMSVTLSLAYSMRKMADANALVRKLPACETVGAATVICSDKTGTLTQNRMEVVWSTVERITEEIAEAVAVNNTSELNRVEKKQLGNPTDAALLSWIDQHDFKYESLRKNFEIQHQLPFSTEHKFMATVGKTKVGKTKVNSSAETTASVSAASESSFSKYVSYFKGAAEIILNRCTLSLEQKAELLNQIVEQQNRGMRLIGIARFAGILTREQLFEANNLTWLGFVAIADPVRPEVYQAIEQCRKAGISIKIVTGDNALTAKEIGRQAGFGECKANEIMTGDDFARLSDEEATSKVQALKILARAKPADKLRLVKLLQKQGEVVAVTGDGVNDGPALNHADVGLSMGKSGTAVAKEASDIVLLDDSFQSVVTAVKWGRSIYKNIQRFLMFQLTINVVALCLAILGPFFGVKLPLTVMQMLWVNLIMDTFAALALATAPADESVLNDQPRNKDAFIITGKMAANILCFGLFFLACLLVLIGWFKYQSIEISDNEPSKGGTIVFTVFVMLQFWNLFNAASWGKAESGLSIFKNNPWFTFIVTAILVGQISIVQFGNQAFRTLPLSLLEWVMIIGCTSVVWIGNEVWRKLKLLKQK